MVHPMYPQEGYPPWYTLWYTLLYPGYTLWYTLLYPGTPLGERPLRRVVPVLLSS